MLVMHITNHRKTIINKQKKKKKGKNTKLNSEQEN